MSRFTIAALVMAISMGAFAVTSKAADAPDKAAGAFKALDTDKDGKLSEAEYVGKKQGEKATKAKEEFKKLDKNNDGFLTLDEFKAGFKDAPKPEAPSSEKKKDK